MENQWTEEIVTFFEVVHCCKQGSQYEVILQRHCMAGGTVVPNRQIKLIGLKSRQWLVEPQGSV